MYLSRFALRRVQHGAYIGREECPVPRSGLCIHLALRLALSTVVQHGAFIGEATIYRERATTALRHSTGTFSTEKELKISENAHPTARATDS